jgi:phosphate acetyltransferase
MDLLQAFREKAARKNGTIVLPEGFDERTLRAAAEIKTMAKVVVLGVPDRIRAHAEGISVDLKGVELVDPTSDPNRDRFVNYLFEKREKKGMTHEQAEKALLDPLYFGATMVQFGLASGMVAGAANTTADVLRSALHVIGVRKGLSTVSSSFIMVVPDYMGQDRVYLFGDCAVVPNPTAEQLADIAESTAFTRRSLIGDEPQVAMLSFSTKGSANHELADKVVEACRILKERGVDFAFDGEMQADAAIVPKIAASKAPGSSVAGHANVLIFPDLQAGNIGYKLVQRFAKAEAIGPVIQGLAKPVCDLSRGCSFEDIVNTAALVLLLS